MTDSLARALARIHVLPATQAQEFLHQWQRWEVSRDQLILREHQVADYFWYLERGAVRIFYRKHHREVTEWLALDDQFFLSITSFFERMPSRLLIHTLEPSVIRGIHYNVFMQMADRYHEVEKLLRKMVTSSLILSQQRMESIQFETAQQRYQRILAQSPNIIHRVPGLYIASFLGITKETLSRIRGMQ
ncbi:MAG: Crp/Fnr family transcriptional regulator [Chitinophagaceae bacterium]|nr:Crp/Fnr family transcriptional regulator [Chitinophagaceae bacterium]